MIEIAPKWYMWAAIYARPQIMNANCYLVFFQYTWPANESAIQPIMAKWKETTHDINETKNNNNTKTS